MPADAHGMGEFLGADHPDTEQSGIVAGRPRNTRAGGVNVFGARFGVMSRHRRKTILGR